MVVSSDVGDPDDVHPIEKKPIGERLALVALDQLYGMDEDWQGPRVRKYTIMKNKIKVKYEHAKELKTSDGQELRGFEIAGEDEIYHPAQPLIMGTTIELSSDQVREPLYPELFTTYNPNRMYSFDSQFYSCPKLRNFIPQFWACLVFASCICFVADPLK